MQARSNAMRDLSFAKSEIQTLRQALENLYAIASESEITHDPATVAAGVLLGKGKQL